MFRKITINCLKVIFGFAVVIALLSAVFAWRLSEGPVSVKFLLPYAKGLLHRANGEVKIDLDDLIITWAGWERAVDLRALQVRLRSPGTGEQPTRIDEISVTLSTRALFQGELSPTKLEIIRPLIHLSRSENGSLHLNLSESQTGSERTKNHLIPNLLVELAQPPDVKSQLQYLTNVSIVGASMSFNDQKHGSTWNARNTNITMERTPLGSRASFDVTLDLMTSKPQLIGQANFSRSTNTIDISARFSELNLRDVPKRSKRLGKLRFLDASIAGDISARLSVAGAVEFARFKMEASSGVIGTLGLGPQPVAFQSLGVTGRLTRYPDQLHISNLTARFEDATAEAKGVVTRVGDIAKLNASIQIPELSYDEMRKLWLPGVGKKTRDWVVTNVHKGVITNGSANLTASIKLDSDPGDSFQIDSINGRFGLEDITVNYLSQMPPITQLVATTRFDANRFDFTVHEGHVGELKIDEGTVAITDTEKATKLLSISTLLRGPVHSALDLIARPRLNIPQRFMQAGKGAKGRHETHLNIALPLKSSLKAEDIRVTGKSNIKDLAISNLFRGKGIDNGWVTLSVIDNSLSASGKINFAGTPAQFKWTEKLARRDNFTRRLEASLTANKKLATLFGLDDNEIWEGSVPLTLVYEARRDNKANLSAELDLKNTWFKLPGFEWEKPPGRPSKARFTASFDGATIRSVDHFKIEAGAFSTSGEITFAELLKDSALSIDTLKLHKFRLGATKLAADVRRDKNRRYMITVKGGRLNAAPFIDRLQEISEKSQLPAFQLSGTFEKLSTGRGAPTKNVNMKLHYNGNRWEFIDMVGALPGDGKAIEFRIRPNTQGQVMAVYSADAGMFLKAMGITNTIVGGSVEVSAVRKGGAHTPWIGTAKMKKFRLANAPGIAQLLTIASLTGLSNLVAGKGLEFRRLSFPFVFEGKTANIENAQGVGSEIGITASGKVDFGRKSVDLEGTIVPAYTINSLVGTIPIVGTIISGEKGGGIFAASYKVSGPVEKPVMSVNPISALAPGFLRKLLRAGEGVNEGKTPTEEETLREKRENKTSPNQ